MAGNPACLTFIPMLSAFVDGELAPNDRVNVERHLAACRDCTGRAADIRATSGLVRIGLDMAADDVDFKEFTNNVLARLTPHKPPLLERLRLSLSETFQHQRGPMIASFATIAAVLAIVATLTLREGTPLGYASEQMAVQSVETGDDGTVAPVVMTTENGSAIIWMVEHADLDQPSLTGGDDEDDDDEDDEEDVIPRDNGTGLGQKPPTGGTL